MAERYKVELGQAIKRRREALGLTQRQLATATHYKEAQTVSRWETGTNMPGNLDAVAEALDCTLAELVEGIIPPNKKVARKLGIVTANGTPDLAETFSGEPFDQIVAKLDRIEQAINSLEAAQVQTAATLLEVIERLDAMQPPEAGAQ